MTTTIVYNFSSSSCHRCRLFLPTFNGWAAKYRDKADFVVVNLDQATPQLLKEYQVTSVPTVVVLRGDKVAARFVGAPTEQEIAAVLGVTTSSTDQTPTNEKGG